MHTSALPPSFEPILVEFLPLIRQLAGGQRYAIAIGGSFGKGTWDARSDIDFRLYTDQRIPWEDTHPELWAPIFTACDRWKQRGILVDGVWARPVGEIDSALDAWLGGKVQPQEMLWTIWGYHLLTDLANQAIVEDPFGIIAGWKARLVVYPPSVKRAILAKYLESLQYWCNDYHYAHKVERGDSVFTASMASKLIHEILQVLFALNETYFPGDGSTLTLTAKFAILPADFPARVVSILYPQPPDVLVNQYIALCALIDDVVSLTGNLSENA
jgi:hypothetical protein